MLYHGHHLHSPCVSYIMAITFIHHALVISWPSPSSPCVSYIMAITFIHHALVGG